MLETGGPAVAMALEEWGRALGEIGLDDAPEGLSVWRGRIVQEGDDANLDGSFRALEEFERKKLGKDEHLWDEDHWGSEFDAWWDAEGNYLEKDAAPARVAAKAGWDACEKR